MNRRQFSLMTACGGTALAAGLGWPKSASAAVSAAQAEQLKSTLTPMGANPAGNADGSIPPWTGGLSTVPADFVPGKLMPDMFASDPKVVSINAANMVQYQDKLTPGVVEMMTKFPDFRIDVYPTHRTGICPQWVYDNVYQNALSAQLNPGGARLGFTNAYGGVPFPIPDISDPLVAGAQIIWNHSCRWQAYQTVTTIAAYVMNNGVLTLASGFQAWGDSPYYNPDGNLSTYSGYFRRLLIEYSAPPSLNGQQLMDWEPSDPTNNPKQAWQYLTGQGRVRKAPELSYDTPAGQEENVANYDEFFVFYGPLDRYDWKFIGKKEMYIPYNNNRLFLATPEQAHLTNFINPDFVRWELHRVWVVEATLHPGSRNVLARRRYYIDEDTWLAVIGETYDAHDNMYKIPMMFLNTRPEIPGVIYGNSVNYDLQLNEYATQGGNWNLSPYDQYEVRAEFPADTFNPQAMGAEAAF